MGFRATLNFRKFKVALNPMYRIAFNFAKSYILSCLSKFYNKKEIHPAILKICLKRKTIKLSMSKNYMKYIQSKNYIYC